MYDSLCMTQWSATEIIKKTDARLALRGALDSLQCEILLLQAHCAAAGKTPLAEALQSAAELLTALQHGRLTTGALREYPLFGMALDALQTASHEAFCSFTPRAELYLLGETPLRLNLLRAHVREAELVAAHVCALHPYEAFEAAQYALNRLSSGLYYLFAGEAGKA